MTYFIQEQVWLCAHLGFHYFAGHFVTDSHTSDIGVSVSDAFEMGRMHPRSHASHGPMHRRTALWVRGSHSLWTVARVKQAGRSGGAVDPLP